MMLFMAAAVLAGANPVEVQVRRAYQTAPRPVRTFLVRRSGCNHWGGEEANDADRARQIAQAVRKLRFDRIEADERRLKRSYAKSRRVRWLLATTRDWDTMP